MKIKFEQRTCNNPEEFRGWKIWVQPKPTTIYAIGADVAEGVNKDASCAQVIDCTTGLHVATFWSNNADIDEYAAELYKGGHYFNKAGICIEANNHGNGIIAHLGGALGGLAYPALYKRITFDEYTQKRTKQIGFHTGPTTKPRLIGNLNQALKSGELITRDKYTINELNCYTKDSKTGKMGAKGSSHDDRVMALALAWEQARLIIEAKAATSYNTPTQNYDKATGFPIGTYNGEEEEGLW